MKLRYDSATTLRTPEDINFRLRLWTDEALSKPPILMASQAYNWTGISVINASENIYFDFMRQKTLPEIKNNDQNNIFKLANFDFVNSLAKLPGKLFQGLSNAGGMHDAISTATWLGSKTFESLTEIKSIMSKLLVEHTTLTSAYENMLFIEHYPGQPEAPFQDGLTAEKFIIVSYKDGYREQLNIIFKRDTLNDKYGVSAD